MNELYAVVVNNVLKGVEFSQSAALSLAKQLSPSAAPTMEDGGGVMPNLSGTPKGDAPPEALILKVGITAVKSSRFKKSAIELFNSVKFEMLTIHLALS